MCVCVFARASGCAVSSLKLSVCVCGVGVGDHTPLFSFSGCFCPLVTLLSCIIASTEAEHTVHAFARAHVYICLWVFFVCVCVPVTVISVVFFTAVGYFKRHDSHFICVFGFVRGLVVRSVRKPGRVCALRCGSEVLSF